ncbi:DUF6463 family protein [Kitasatospora sp. NPDC059722]|uniref:DUF6463 family protein n=1 Tax=Kitasatospora sp. NPDC059722 TaxID=3346925 RepID=UPI003699F182
MTTTTGARPAPTTGIITWAGWLLVVFGTAHTVLALTKEHAASHIGEWLGGELWGASLSEMSPAGSAYWLTVDSFAPPFVIIGLTILWLNRRGIAPPPFIAWALLTWTVAGAALAGFAPPLDLAAEILLLVAARRANSPERRPPGFTPVLTCDGANRWTVGEPGGTGVNETTTETM